MERFRLTILVESRIRWKVYVRFGGEYWETYHRNMTRRRVLSLHTPLSRWIARYKEFGEAGLRIRQYTYSGDFKLSAIRHMHENHLSLTETTAKFGIYNESTLSKWERIYYEEGESGLYRDNRGKMRTKPNKQELQPQEENDLRVENQRLRAEVAYLKKLRVLVEERIVRENGNGQKPSKN